MEIRSLKKQRFVHLFRQRVGEAVSEIQSRFVAAFAEVTVGLSRNLSLFESNGLNLNRSITQKIVQSPAQHGISIAVSDDSGFDIGHGRYATDRRLLQDLSDFGRFGFIP
jgi:hypothetical protein